MNTLLLANHWWQKLAIPVVIFVTNIDCDELTTYPGLQDILEDDTQADYGDTILMNNVRVQLIWIDVSCPALKGTGLRDKWQASFKGQCDIP